MDVTKIVGSFPLQNTELSDLASRLTYPNFFYWRRPQEAAISRHIWHS